MIETALLAEREQAAKVAKVYAERYRVKSQSQRRRGDDSLSQHFLSECNAALEIEAAIREGKPQE
jgi:ribosome recycling factor